MNSAQRAVVAAAKKDGLSPMEVAAELMNHDITEVVLGLMRKREVAFNKLGEKEQDAVIAELGSELKKITSTAARVINSQGVECVQAKMKSLKIDGKLTATMVIEGDEPNRHVLTDKTHDRSDILIVLYSNNYNEGMSAHVGEKDQKPLDLGGDEKPSKAKAERKGSATSAASLAKKAIEIPPKLLADAKDFVTIQQNCKPSALQNHLKIGLDKAMAVLAKLEEDGVVTFVGDEKTGEYQLVRAPKADAAELTPELYEKIKAKVIADQRFSIGALAVAFDVETGLIESAIEELVADGTISEEGETGERTVLQLAE